jgi:hypothetical protein
MNHEDLSHLSQALAEVTPSGILFNGKYYSCELALKKQWFSLAKTNYLEDIPILFDPQSDDYIYIENSAYDICIARRIDHPENPIDEQYQNAYFKQVEELKNLFRQLNEI